MVAAEREGHFQFSGKCTFLNKFYESNPPYPFEVFYFCKRIEQQIKKNGKNLELIVNCIWWFYRETLGEMDTRRNFALSGPEFLDLVPTRNFKFINA